MLVVLLCADVAGAEGEAVAAARFFEEEVRPVLATKCVRCHGPEKQKGDLRLDTAAALNAGGSQGAAIVPGQADASLLVQAIRYEDLEMPPDGPLPDAEIATLVAWIDAGASWPAHTATILASEEVINTDNVSWWAVQPLGDTRPPVHPGDNWSRNPIDQFVYQRLAAEEMTPAPQASRLDLVRRLYYDVIGLPPTPEEIDAFLTDASPNPWERLVDRLLDDPRYGEHWARFWLDLVRYAESDGWNKDSYRPHIWRYRDYVVDAFNSDKPFPQFVREQLAGDEMPGDDPAQRIATGFLRLGIYEYNQRDARGQWNDIMNEITDVTGDAFLGVSMSCSRCHNHKFDPIPQTDYFGLRAFFEPLVWTDAYPGATDAEQQAWRDQQDVWEAQTLTVRQEIAALCAPYYEKKWASTVDKFPLEIQACFNKPVEERTSWEHQMAYLVERQFYEEGQPALKSMSAKDKKTLEALEARLKLFDDIKPKPLPTVMSVKDFASNISPTTIPGDTRERSVPPGFLSVLSDIEEGILLEQGPDAQSSGRRTALAEWIGSADNPLTTRVFVNRIWQQHFGAGIASSSDFGHLGEAPTHPALLDWLTQIWIENDWSLKHVHRLILLSATWQQSTEHPNAGEYLARDPAVDLLWRARTRRLKAEQLRDALLVASGELDPAVGGPSVKSEVPRRTLYLQSRRNAPHKLLQSFDTPPGLSSVAQRSMTTTPLQALDLFNGAYVLGRARKMAELILQEETGDEVRQAFRLAWAREPTAAEWARARDFVSQDSADDRVSSEDLVSLCHVLLNANAFLYIN